MQSAQRENNIGDQRQSTSKKFNFAMKSEDKHLFYFITKNQLSGTEKKWIQSKKRRGGILGMDQKGGLKLVKAWPT